MKNNSIITSEIAISFKLLGNKKYLKNLLTHFNNTDKYLFVDFSYIISNK